MQNNKVLHLYPIDYPFETLVARVKEKKLKLDPEFQRTYKWDEDGNERASRFIESCLMRIPIPACYFAENQDSTHLVIDGVQRITTISKFFNDEFSLEGLTVFKELEGKKFSEIDAELKSELETTTIRCIILRKENPKYLIQEIFARLNQGAVKLSNQEIRHAIFPGNFDKLLKDLSLNDLIVNFGIGQSGKNKKNSREDEEMILRFFALQSDLSDYQDNISKYLDGFMEKNQNVQDEDIEKMKNLFIDTLNKCNLIFSDKLFSDTTKDKPKQSLLYYDLLMHSFIDFDLNLLVEKKENIQTAFKELCNNEEFKKTISGGLGKKGSILKRRQLWSAALSQCL